MFAPFALGFLCYFFIRNVLGSFTKEELSLDRLAIDFIFATINGGIAALIWSI